MQQIALITASIILLAGGLPVIVSPRSSILTLATESPISIVRANRRTASDHYSNPDHLRSDTIDVANSSDNAGRVRRAPASHTQTNNIRRTLQSQQVSELECPSRRLFQSLLPVEYAGSPASKSPRAHCDCSADPYGWHITCFAGSIAPKNGGTGASSLTFNAPMPNQLHPAFRDKQQQQPQQQQRSSSSNSIRRVNRSPVRWMGQGRPSPLGWHRNVTANLNDIESASSSDTSEPASSSSASSPSYPASHEGFGEEPAPPAPVAPNVASSAGAKPAARQPEQDAIVTLSSSDSYTLMQMQQQDKSRQQQAGNLRTSEKLVLLPQAGSSSGSSTSSSINSNQNNFNFQTVPVLFSVIYTRNNMIEIDCDQAAPNYKPAMFQGFNVSEITAFTFNNCHLPNIPFSVLLHRTRSSLPDQPVPSSATGAVAAAGGGDKPRVQSLKPDRMKQHQNLLRSKRRANLEENNVNSELGGFEEEEKEANSRSVDMDLAALVPRDTASNSDQPAGDSPLLIADAIQPGVRIPSGARQSAEPKVKSLTVNLNTVVDQRTLISLLTGLGQLEDLQLNYMQLNLTNFEPDLDADLTNSATTASEELNLQASAATGVSSMTTRTHQAPSSTSADTTTTSERAQQSPPSSQSPSSPTTSSITTTTTTTTVAPQTTQILANQTPSSTSVTSAAPTTRTAPASTTPISTGTAGTAKPRSKPQVKPVTLTTTTTNSSSSRPLMSLGAPRGLLHAQATGIPPTTNVMSVTSAPSPTTMLVASSSTTTASMATTTSTTTTPPPTTVPSVSLSTATASVRSSTNSQPQTQPITANQLHLRPQMGSSTGGQVSVAPTQMVHFSGSPTTNATPVRPTAGMFHLSTPTTGGQVHPQSVVSTSVSHSVSTSSSQPNPQNKPQQNSGGWSSSSTSSSVSQPQTSQPGPSTPVNPPAGTRLSIGGQQMGDFTSNGNVQWSGSHWNTPTTPGLTTGPTFTEPSLSAPANTPAFPSHSNGFGIRTGGSSVPLSSGMTNLNMMQNNAGNQPQFRPTTTGQTVGFRTFAGAMAGRRQQTGAGTTVSTSSPDETSNPFVAAGGRLYNSNNNQQTPLAGNRRGQPQASNSFVSANGDYSDQSSPSTLAFVDGEIGRVSVGTTNVRRKRFAPAAEEFELSFGEILPNLRTLKLESFIDLSARANNKDKDKDNSHRRGNPRRVKRQFQPGDVPEKDESHLSGSETDGLSGAPGSSGDSDTLIAEESSVHHNSVMASSENRAPVLNKRPPTRGTQWQLAHGEHESNFNGGDLWTSGSTPDQDAVSNSTADQLPAESNAGDARARYLSLLLVKMFSRLTKLRVLQLSSNDIPYWPDNVLFDSRNTLARLYLISNNIRQLGKKSFANLNELHTLDLSSNQLRQLNGDLFRDLQRLRNLRACRNLFRKLPSKLFARIHQQASNHSSTGNHQRLANRLESVDFSKNRYLSQLSADLFAAPQAQGGNSQLVDMGHAPITSLNLSDCSFNDQLAGKSAEIMFATLPDLINLSLNGNKLREILMTSALFGKNGRLQRLDLSHNQLTVLSANLFNANASQITELQLHHNQLSQIPDQFLFNLRKLRKLSLAHNRLTQLNARIFFTNQFIEHIDLSENQLLTLNTQQSSMIPFGNGANLKYLNLAHNNLTNFESDLFEVAWSFYTNLNLLDLSHNQFSGQISMPIFYTITDEMLLNLASNSIKSVSVEALMQHEQILDKYAAFEGEHGSESRHDDHQSTNKLARAGSQSRVPTVNIKLTNNPISCDCMLEPLVSYTRRVAAATNPSLVASIFGNNNNLAQPQPRSSSDSHGHNDAATADPLTASSRYSVLDDLAAPTNNRHDGGTAEHAKHAISGSPTYQPQVFYQFKFNDLYCAQPANLQRRLLSHISIGDLLCPIRDERLCPGECLCHYQSAFKTVIIDCNNRKLTRVPNQLTDAANFVHFDVESSFSANNGSLAAKSLPGVDKVIIRLDNNQLRSMDQLVKLFTINGNSSSSGQQSGSPELRNRFARNPARASSPTNPGADSLTSEGIPVELLSSASAQPLVSQNASSKKMISPVAIARNLNGGSRQRSRRQVASGETPVFVSTYPTELGADRGFDSVVANHLGEQDPAATTSSGNGPETQPLSTAVLESAEEFRNKRYPLTCELYLDHNLIDTIPASFLRILDQVRSSSMQSSVNPPQAALPTLMLDPPVHTKINNIANVPDPDPMRASSSVTNTAISDSDSDSAESPNHEPTSDRLFGRQPLAPERKATLMETINQNVRLNQQQHRQSGVVDEGGKVSISPSLVVLSLRYNNLASIEAKILQRLSKLIKSSNTKLYLGHNPFNCSDNYTPLNSSSSESITRGPIEMLPASPMGEHLAVSDSSSGAYLENADDLSPSASSSDPSYSSSVSTNQLMPADCPVGQLKTWLTRHHSSIGDLDELYCVRMSPELAEKLRLAANSSTGSSTSEHLRINSPNGNSNKWDHDHPWASSVPRFTLSGRSGGLVSGVNGSQVSKNGLTWDSELLSSTAKLIDVDLYDLCPYSGNQLLDASAVGLLSAGHQQALISVAVVFILISLCLLLMLVYFGDTQTILAFVYIHLNPLYSCLRLNESHLDGDKLYDAFVSYSSADRDIVMELIEKLELQDSSGGGVDSSKLNKFSAGKSLDKSHDTLITEADLVGGQRPEMNQNGVVGGQLINNNSLSRRTNSFQDLSIMSRSTSRIMKGSIDDGISNSNGQLSPPSDSGEGRMPYRLCIHERDWLPGHLISWNIVNSVQNSRRTILILSKDFIKSVWFQVEFHTAYYQMLEDKIDRLIVIVRGELPPKNELDKNLAFLLTTKTYLTWGEKWFWERLHYALPHRSVPPALANRNRKPVKQHHHHYVSKKLNGSEHQVDDDMASRQKPLIMSSIGKDCSNLLIPANGPANQTTVGSASSSGSTGSNTRSSSSSFLSGGSSTGNLFTTTATTNNELLSKASVPSATKLTIGPRNIDNGSSQPIDSGRVTVNRAASIGRDALSSQGPSAGVTSIMLDADGGNAQQTGASSRLKARKQEKLQNFVDKSIADHFNLSEL